MLVRILQSLLTRSAGRSPCLIVPSKITSSEAQMLCRRSSLEWWNVKHFHLPDYRQLCLTVRIFMNIFLHVQLIFELFFSIILPLNHVSQTKWAECIWFRHLLSVFGARGEVERLSCTLLPLHETLLKFLIHLISLADVKWSNLLSILLISTRQLSQQLHVWTSLLRL